MITLTVICLISDMMLMILHPHVCTYKCSIVQIASRYCLVHNSKQPWYNFLWNFSSGNDKVFKMCKAYASVIYIVLAYRHAFKMAALFLPTGSLLIICGVCKCPRDLKYTLLQQLWAQREGEGKVTMISISQVPAGQWCDGWGCSHGCNFTGDFKSLQQMVAGSFQHLTRVQNNLGNEKGFIWSVSLGSAINVLIIPITNFI